MIFVFYERKTGKHADRKTVQKNRRQQVLATKYCSFRFGNLCVEPFHDVKSKFSNVIDFCLSNRCCGSLSCEAESESMQAKRRCNG